MTKSDRIKLRSIGQDLADTSFVGKDGVTENVIKQISDNLTAHELVKIKVQKNAPLEIGEIAEEIASKCGAEVVTIIGSKILVYRFSTKEKIKHIL